MEPNEIFAQRLKNARVMKGLSMDDLVHRMDHIVSKMTVSKYENCQLSPNSSVLVSLSRALDLPFDYFFRPFTLEVNSVKFRKNNKKLSAKLENSIKETMLDLIERYIYIEEICHAAVNFKSPANDIVHNNEDVKKAVRQVRAAWDIGSDGILNVIELLEEHGVKVMEFDAPGSFDGLSSVVNGIYPVVILNKSFSSERKRFTALHELGHLILNFASGISEGDEEKLCNFFASEMLISEEVFKRRLGITRHDISYQELKELQIRFGISCEALMHKARLYDVISEQRYKTFRFLKSKNAVLKTMIERSLYPAEESCRFVSLVYKALSSELITVSKAASLLNQSTEQVRKDLTLV